MRTYQLLYDNKRNRNIDEVRTRPPYYIKQLCEDIASITLYTPNELARIIKLVFFTILCKAKSGYNVKIPNFGNIHASIRKPSKTKTIVGDIEDYPHSMNVYISLYPFARWFLSPHKYNNVFADRINIYFYRMDQYLKEAQGSEDFRKAFPPEGYLKAAKERLKKTNWRERIFDKKAKRRFDSLYGY